VYGSVGWGPPCSDPSGYCPSLTSNNCYSYAVNDLYGHPEATKPQPGEASYAPYYSDFDSGIEFLDDGWVHYYRYGYSTGADLTKDRVSAAAVSDGLVPAGPYDTCEVGGHKVALFVDPGRDYHWYRQDRGGLWSHKPGWSKPTNRDADNALIVNPLNANTGNYTDFGGFYCVPPGGIRTGKNQETRVFLLSLRRTSLVNPGSSLIP
jgi:hypothetical protein